MRPTLKQVSDDTGLSIATVSRALRRKKRRYSVNEEKIYAAARKLGYPFIGESDESDKTTIAVVTEIRQGEFYSSLFHGLHSATRDSKSDVVFLNVDGRVDNDYNWKDDPVDYIIKLSKKYSGICLFLPGLDKESYAAIKEGVGTYPIVSLIPGKNLKIDTVSFDSYSGGYMIAKHFEEVGYTNMGIITGPKNVMDSSFRKNGFIDHINERSSLGLSWSFAGDFSSEAGSKAFLDFKEKNLKKIAIFGCNDHSCFGFMKAATEHGYKIPEDFIIAGFDNLSFCESITPELTSISTNFESLGKQAIRTIENMVSEKEEIIGQVSMIPVKIVIRKSTKV
jgi:DNA-binding LacI/PurR family transcriptional regulator